MQVSKITHLMIKGAHKGPCYALISTEYDILLSSAI